MSELFEKVPKKRTFRELVVKKIWLEKKKKKNCIQQIHSR